MSKQMKLGLEVVLLASTLALTSNITLAAESVAHPEQTQVTEALDGTIRTPNQTFGSWSEYVNSDYFKEHGKRCGTVKRKPKAFKLMAGDASDCTLAVTNPSNDYDPSVARYRIPVVVHVIQNSAGSGFISEAQVASQIQILNEDFLALTGSNGALGTDVQIEFALATVDPNGQPTNGITYSTNDAWFNDSGDYWTTLGWDTTRYMNIYTNTAGGNLGYVPDLPQGNVAGTVEDRVVVLWSSFGLNGPIGPPYNLGRTTTHEVGHYLGLDHTFGGGCGSATDCYTTGDLLCDTNPQAQPSEGCIDSASCGVSDPFRNYMDYSDDSCMQEFTPEQARRMRCSLENYRQGVLVPVDVECGDGEVGFGEECDDGNTVAGDGCDAACQFEHTCGDGVLEPGEECDDGNTSAGDGCDADCELEPVCGNNIVETGEQCDPPDGTTCSATCQTIVVCGDGVVGSGEQCDDGNLISGDGCSASCRWESTAGNCCAVGHGSGCEIDAVESCVCAQDSFCCQEDWDEQCVDQVESFGCGTCSVVAPAEVSGPGAEQPLRFVSKSELMWESLAVSGAMAFDVYRGSVSDLPSGTYGSCLRTRLTESSTSDSQVPPSGTSWLYLVAGQNDGGYGSLGQTSAGAPRTIDPLCGQRQMRQAQAGRRINLMSP